MPKNRVNKVIGIIVEVLLYLLMLGQMLYVFTGNDLHEFLGMGYFVCLIIHIIIKRKWFVGLFKRKTKRSTSRLVADVLIILLLIAISLLMLSSMGVSRTIFPHIHFLGNAFFHRLLATIALVLSILHGGMHFYIRSKRKKLVVFVLVLLSIGALAIGLYMVPYLNRHFKRVEITLQEKISGEKLERTEASNTAVVYFTRLGNTDFEQDVEATSGASLLIADGELMGNTQLLAEMLKDIGGYDIYPITVTEQKYPSSYNDTISVARKEIKADARPAIEAIDVSKYKSIILVYPLWWGTIPNPVATFLEGNDFSDKTVYLLATQGSSGFGSSVSDVEKLIPQAEVVKGISIYCDDIPNARAELMDWVKNFEK